MRKDIGKLLRKSLAAVLSFSLAFGPCGPGNFPAFADTGNFHASAGTGITVSDLEDGIPEQEAAVSAVLTPEEAASPSDAGSAAETVSADAESEAEKASSSDAEAALLDEEGMLIDGPVFTDAVQAGASVFPEAKENITEPLLPETKLSPGEFPAVELTEFLDSIKVTVCAEEGVLPNGVRLSVKYVGNEADYISAVADSLLAEGKTVASARALDVTLYDPEGNEIEPDGSVTVTITDIGLVPKAPEESSIGVFRVSDEADEVEKMETSVAEAELQVFETDHFTVYVIGNVKNNENAFILIGGQKISDGEVVDVMPGQEVSFSCPGYYMIVDKSDAIEEGTWPFENNWIVSNEDFEYSQEVIQSNYGSNKIRYTAKVRVRAGNTVGDTANVSIVSAVDGTETEHWLTLRVKTEEWDYHITYDDYADDPRQTVEGPYRYGDTVTIKSPSTEIVENANGWYSIFNGWKDKSTGGQYNAGDVIQITGSMVLEIDRTYISRRPLTGYYWDVSSCGTFEYTENGERQKVILKDQARLYHSDGTEAETEPDPDNENLVRLGSLYLFHPEITGITPGTYHGSHYAYACTKYNSGADAVYEVTGLVPVRGYEDTSLIIRPAEKYTVTWKDEDGTVLGVSKNCLKGELPEFIGKTPEKAGDAAWTYLFLGWDPEIKEVSEDAVYTAVYAMAPKAYLVKYELTGEESPLTMGSEIPEDIVHPAGTSVPVAADLTTAETDKDGIPGTWVFSGWSTNDAVISGGSFVMPAKDVTLSGSWTFLPDIPVTGVTLDQHMVCIYEGDSFDLAAAIRPQNATNKNVIWYSMDPSILSVEGEGQPRPVDQAATVTALSPGKTMISVETEDGSYTDVCEVVVFSKGIPVTGITLDQTEKTVTEGDSFTLTATILPENASYKEVSWGSSDPAVVAVEPGENGDPEGFTATVTALSPGTAVIHAIAIDRDGSFVATCTVTVEEKVIPVTGVNISRPSVSVPVGGSYQLEAWVRPENATNQRIIWTSSNLNYAVVSSTGLVTARRAGTATITARSADGGYAAHCRVTITVPVTGVTLDETEMTVPWGNSFTLTPTIAPENATNKNVNWSSSDPEVVTVNNNGQALPLSAGTAILTVETEDGGFTASCTVTVVIPVTGIILDQHIVCVDEGDSFNLAAAIQPQNATNKNIIWYSMDPSIASVDVEGQAVPADQAVTVTALSPGETIISVETENSGYTDICEVVVFSKGVPVTGITLDQTEKTITKGSSFTLNAAVAPENATNKNVSWSSSDPAVAEVDDTGKVSAVGPGTAVVTVTTEEGGFVALCTVTVQVPVNGVNINTTARTILLGNSFQLRAWPQPVDATNKNVTWTSSDPAVAEVDSTGLVTALKGGTADVTVETEDGGFTAVCRITVRVPVTSVKINTTAKTIIPGKIFQLAAWPQPSNATDKAVTWTSSNPSVATVSSTGLVTAVKAGTATVTVTTADGGYTAACAITSGIPVNGVKINTTAKTIIPGKTFQLAAWPQPANAANKAVTWTSSDPSVAAVSSTGLVTAVKAGTATVTVKTEDGGYTAVCKITAGIPVNGVKINTTAKVIAPGKTFQLAAWPQPANAANKAVTWTSSDTSVAKVSGTGLVTAVKAGTATITVKTEDGGYTAVCKITVDIPVTGVKINTTAKTITAGKTFQLAAWPQPSNALNKQVTWSSSNTAVATVSSTGLVKAVKKGTATITVKTVDGGFTKACRITVR